MSKVIRIDDEVWASLEARVQGFGDNPNTVLRRVFGLEAGNVSVPLENTEDNMDDRVGKLLDLVTQDLGHRPPAHATKNSFALRSEVGRVVVYVYSQKKRLNVETRKDLAEKLGIEGWNHEVKNGWHNSGIDSVYWYVPNGDEETYHRVARIIARLLQGNA